MQQELYGAVETAIYETVNGYVDSNTRQRGATALAPKVGMLPATLSNKANPLQDHKLGLCESVPLQLVANDFRILYAYNEALQHVAYKLPATNHVGDVELLDQYADMHARLGELAKYIRDALADGDITTEEVQRMREAFDASARAGLGLLARLEALVDDRR
ncbi:phage regulatory CII family protein [Rhodanobacter sp. UC4437_H4]